MEKREVVTDNIKHKRELVENVSDNSIYNVETEFVEARATPDDLRTSLQSYIDASAINESYEARTPDMSFGTQFIPNRSVEHLREVNMSAVSNHITEIENEYEIYESVPVRQWPITLLPTAECYDMTHGNQGKVIIFNHKEYIDGTDKREGTEKDVKRIENTFRNLDFDVIIHTDLMLADIQDVLDGLRRADYSDDNCLVIFVLTHGTSDGCVKAKDEMYKLQIIWETFAGTNCPSLIGKPKLLFCQACRGHNVDEGVPVTTTPSPAFDVVSEEISYKMPSHADIMIGYSCFEDFVSHRNPRDGSWYIKALCEVLESDSVTDDILSMMTTVSRKVGTEYSALDDASVQMPTVTSTLMRKLYFHDFMRSTENVSTSP